MCFILRKQLIIDVQAVVLVAVSSN